jgi:hypothetical protein
MLELLFETSPIVRTAARGVFPQRFSPPPFVVAQPLTMDSARQRFLENFPRGTPVRQGVRPTSSRVVRFPTGFYGLEGAATPCWSGVLVGQGLGVRYA